MEFLAHVEEWNEQEVHLNLGQQLQSSLTLCQMYEKHQN